ncbi:MAG: hypothetical protein HUJ56_06685, partial [Erysipelotrichaceae bacterium]|nr:hypothetical protein [Erysipelotrichaceae bacterium]
MNRLIEVPSRNSKESDLQIAKQSKVNKPSKKYSSNSGGLINRIPAIVAFVDEHLGEFKDKCTLITTEEALHEYIDKCLDSQIVAIDTETTGLNTRVDKIVGIGLYTPNDKPCYIPVRHKNYITLEYSEENVPLDVLQKELSRLENIRENIMFNANFDLRMLWFDLRVRLHCTWDCSLASRLLNENEKDKRLKPLHKKYVLRGKDDAFTYSEIFGNTEFALIPTKTAYLYGAHDPLITYEYYDYQRKYIYYESDCTLEDRNGMNGVSWVFFNIEMPCVDATVNMETNGVCIDLEYAEELK